jgi:hypothetical protein
MNSSTPLGGVALVASVDRPDLCVLATIVQLKDLLNQSETRFFPLYLSGQPNRNRWARYRNKARRRVEGMDRDEAALRNVASLRRAAQRVDQGSSLLYAPMGGTFFYKKDWKSGVGLLFKLIKNPETQIVFVRLSGGRSSHLLRLMNPYWFWPFCRKEQLGLRIEPPIRLAEFQDPDLDAEEISELIKRRYIELCGAL